MLVALLGLDARDPLFSAACISAGVLSPAPAAEAAPCRCMKPQEGVTLCRPVQHSARLRALTDWEHPSRPLRLKKP